MKHAKDDVLMMADYLRYGALPIMHEDTVEAMLRSYAALLGNPIGYLVDGLDHRVHQPITLDDFGGHENHLREFLAIYTFRSVYAEPKPGDKA